MADASCTSIRTLSYADFIKKCSRVPFERVLKQPGSKKLVHGEWVEVKPDDDDAIKTGPASRHFGGRVKRARAGPL